MLADKGMWVWEFWYPETLRNNVLINSNVLIQSTLCLVMIAATVMTTK